MDFPLPLDKYKPIKLDPSAKKLSKEQKEHLEKNIQLVRDSIIFFTAYAGKRGLGGHTGGAYDIIPELLIVDGLRRGGAHIHPNNFDEAGHRVAAQYIIAALDKKAGMSISDLLHYREYKSGLPGHPELDEKQGITFSSGRLGHIWGHVNGVAEQNPDQKIVLFGSDGSQQEGNDAESARYAVAHNLDVVLLIDDNNITIEDHPSAYMPGYDITKTLAGHGLAVHTIDGENISELYEHIQKTLTHKGPIALAIKRKMAPGIEGIEDTTKGHDVIPTESAIHYLRQRGHDKAVEMLESAKKISASREYRGSSKEMGKNRSEFGTAICEILEKKSAADIRKNLVVSNDLGGSCGLNIIGKNYPQVYRKAGIMERNNFLVAAGFGSKKGYQGIYATFAAFLEMVVSEVTMSKLNEANVLAHFSHSGIDDMSDNTCHFGVNNFFVQGGFTDENKLYFPADPLQMNAVVKKIFDQPGLRFIFSTRSSVPTILNEKEEPFFGKGYHFTGKDEIIREGKDGYIVSYGDILYRALHAVEELKAEGIDIGLINKPVLNIPDEEMLKKINKAPFVLVAESQSINSGLGIRFGTWLLQRGCHAKYDHIGTHQYGDGGQGEQVDYQGLDPDSIKKKVKEMIKN